MKRPLQHAGWQSADGRWPLKQQQPQGPVRTRCGCVMLRLHVQNALKCGGLHLWGPERRHPMLALAKWLPEARCTGLGRQLRVHNGGRQ